MPESTLTRIMQAVADRIAQVDGSENYYHDLGGRVGIGRSGFDPENEALPSVSVIPVRTSFGDQARSRMTVDLTLAIEAHVAASHADPMVEQIELVEDIKTALLQGNTGSARGLDGLCTNIRPDAADYELRQAGSNYTTALLEITVTYIEHYGDPRRDI